MNKKYYGRREFLALSGAGIAGLAGRAWPRVPDIDARRADLVVFNANVHTVDAGMPKAEAFAVSNGRLVAVGRSEQIRKAFGRGARLFDAGQMTIVPGFIDCHNHAEGESLLDDVLVGNPFEVEFVTIDGIVDKLRKKAAETPEGTWVEGFFFDDTKVKDQRQLNIHDLDRVSTVHPVAVHHRGGHTAFYNSLALRLAGVGRVTPNPSGGTFDRDSNGELNGRVTDNAIDLVNKIGTRATLSAR